MIRGTEVFIDSPDIQFCDSIRIEIGLPFSNVYFQKKDFEKAIKVAALKSLGGYNDPCDRELYLNGELLDKEKIMYWKKECDLSAWIKDKNKSLKKDNKITIEFVIPSNFEHFRNLLVYSCKDKDDRENLYKEMDRWEEINK